MLSRTLEEQSKLLERIFKSWSITREELEKLSELAKTYNSLVLGDSLDTPVIGSHIADYKVVQGNRYGYRDRHLIRDESKGTLLTPSEAKAVLDVIMRIEALHNPKGYGALAPLRYLWLRQQGKTPEEAYRLPRL